MKGRRKKGFTLIELIVVVAVLALLAVVAVPMVASWVDDAKNAEAAANARTIELAMRAYMAKEGLENIANETVMETALGEYGLPKDKIEDSSADFQVKKDGSVTIITENGDGDITFTDAD
ncbi:MAG TPA: prepilin-type N-terminal cleavage/methylation domain-containing protein [Bacillota bacterium]|jgi:type IV pilus assembly protein PilA|nr:prepilin-type N-terminal cleavage/methylation domain-containing protein [Bacillota bacterium]HQC82515.1 prepilin-type N-terminal cleavage/methylation domain-containing protein [Bacillota bacterium]